MLEAIYQDGTIEWFCRNEEAECEFCSTPLSAHIDHSTVRYMAEQKNKDAPARAAFPL